MLTTISLSKWMLSRWAFAPASRQDIGSRKSWSQQVEDIYRGRCQRDIGGDNEAHERKKSPDELYLENASAIAFLLLQQILGNNKETFSGSSNIAIDNITVTLESPDEVLKSKDNDRLHELYIIKFVNVTLRSVQGQHQPPFLQSLGKVLLKLFTRQESLPDWETLLPRDDDEELFQEEDEQSDNSAEFESDMLKALSILDGQGGGTQFSQRQKQQRHSVESNTFSRIQDQYTALPTSICRLLSDLIDQHVRTKTSFASLDDVSDDLEQMFIEPDIFLHEPTLSDVRLDFGSRLYGRKEEVSQLLDIANDISSRRETGPLEIVSIGGYSGTGKSFLVRQVGQYLSAKGWIFIKGKFDRMRQRDAFSVVTSAFESFCGKMQAMKDGGKQNDLEYCSRVSTAVLDAIGFAGVGYLSQILPSLDRVIIVDAVSTSDSERSTKSDLINAKFDVTPVQSAAEALMSQRRREYLLCSFVEAVLGVGRPMLLFYDDIQWADAATLGFLRKLLKHLADRNKPRKHIMFTQAFRDNEVNGTRLPVASSIESYDSVNITKIKLDGFSKRALNGILSPVLCLPRRITSPLSEMIHQKTMGNMFFVVEFMKTLERPDKKILSFSFAKRRWIWDTDTIAVMSISDSVAGLIVEKVIRMEKTMLNSLIIASCFGSQWNTHVMELLNGLKGIPDIVQNLDAAVDEGLIEKAGPLFMFAHDSIQQSVYELIPGNELIQLHVDIGLLLISKGAHASRDMIDEVFAFAVSNINMALPKYASSDTAVTFTPSQHIVFAKLNLKAGQKAVNGKSDFALAEVHLKAGLSFLPGNSWVDHYDLTLQIFDEYSNVLFVQRNLEELQTHIDVILKNAKCIGDKIKGHELMMSVLTLKGSTSISNALDYAKSVLGALGFPFPLSIDSETVSGVAKSLLSTIITLTPDDVRAFPLMTEKIPLQAMKIMSSVHMPYSFSSPTIFQMMSCQMMQLTIKHGLCVQSAEALANFGYCLMTLFHNYEAGYRMGKLSLMVLERFKATKKVAKVYFIIYGFLSLWKEPMQATVEGLQIAVNIGLVEGDYQNALYNQVVLYRQMYLVGCNLSVLHDRLLGLCRDMMYNKSKSIFFSGFNPVLGDLYSVISLTGGPEDEVYLIFGISRDENEQLLLEKYSATGNAPLIQIVYYHRILSAFWYRDYETAIDFCEKYDDVSLESNLLRVTDILRVVFNGLSSFILSRKKKQNELIAKGEENLLQMQGWASLGSKWNAENKALLLEAECHFAKGDSLKAKAAYEQSIKSAHEHKFIHEEALAYELFGIFCLEEGDMCKGNELLEKAQELYDQWGAHKKADSIFSL